MGFIDCPNEYAIKKICAATIVFEKNLNNDKGMFSIKSIVYVDSVGNHYNFPIKQL